MDFSSIQELKKNPILFSNNINYGRVMSAKLYPNGKMYTAKCFILAAIFEPTLKYTDINSNVIISKNFELEKRSDYLFIFNQLRNFIPSNQLVFHRKKSIGSFFRNMVMIYKNYKKNRAIDDSFHNILRISSLELYYKKLPEKLNCLDLKSKLYISFCDSYLEENLLTQYFNQKKISTATLQHGQYKYIRAGFENTETEAYLNFISNYLFAWGKITEREFLKAGIRKSRILTVGALKEFTDRKSDSTKTAGNRFLIILDGETHHESNINMIKAANKISEKFQLEYDIRYHPDNYRKNYVKVTNNYYHESYNVAHDNLSYYEFSILHMSGVFVEMLSYNLPFFVYEDKYTEDIFKLELITFKTTQDFKKLYIYMRSNKVTFLERLDHLYLQYNISINNTQLRENYIFAVNNILEGRLNVNQS